MITKLKKALSANRVNNRCDVLIKWVQYFAVLRLRKSHSCDDAPGFNQLTNIESMRLDYPQVDWILITLSAIGFMMGAFFMGSWDALDLTFRCIYQ